MDAFKYLLVIGVVTLTSSAAASVKDIRSAAVSDQEGCGKGCQSLAPDSAYLSRCLRYACRKHVFRYYMRVGKRFGTISSDPAFRHRLDQRQSLPQRPLQSAAGDRLPPWYHRPASRESPGDSPAGPGAPGPLAEDDDAGSVSSSRPFLRRRSSFLAMNLNNLYKDTDTPSGKRRWNRVFFIPMSAGARRGFERQPSRLRRRLALFRPRLFRMTS